MRLLLALLFLALPALAEIATHVPVKGGALNHRLSVCIDKADALLMVKTEEKKGFQAAMEMWLSLDKCDVVTVVGPTVGDVIATSTIKRGDKTLTMRVVEIVHEGSVIGYFITSLPTAVERVS